MQCVVSQWNDQSRASTAVSNLNEFALLTDTSSFCCFFLLSWLNKNSLNCTVMPHCAVYDAAARHLFLKSHGHESSIVLSVWIVLVTTTTELFVRLSVSSSLLLIQRFHLVLYHCTQVVIVVSFFVVEAFVLFGFCLSSCYITQNVCWIKSLLRSFKGCRIYTLCLKKRHTLSFAVTLTNIDRFSKFFHWYIVWKICNNIIIKYATTP